MIPGEIYLSDSCNVWDTLPNQSAGIIVDLLDYGDTVLLLQIHGEELKVLTPNGKTGWISPRSDGRPRLRETR